jgi:hypothetical protein
MSLMLCVPFRPRAAHVVPLGPVGRAGKIDQPVAMDHDFSQASEQRLQDQHGSLSMQFAEHRRKRQDEDFVIEIVADMQRPVAPIFRALHIYQRLYDAGGMVAQLGEVSDGGAALVDAHALGVGIVEIDCGHVRLPRLRFTLKNSRRETDLIFGEIADGILRELRLQVEPARKFIEKFICAGARNEAFGSAVHEQAAK